MSRHHGHHDEQDDRERERLLQEILEELRRDSRQLRDIHALLVGSHSAGRFIITQKGDNTMPLPTQGPLVGVAAGASDTFNAQYFNPDGTPGTLPDGVIPVWSSDDSNDVTITPNSTGLSALIAVAATATVGRAVNLAIIVPSALPDGTQPKGVAAMPILPVAVASAGSFIITQGAPATTPPLTAAQRARL